MDTIFGTGSTNGTSPWRPEPTFRGTFGILSTCLITLGLCVWSAIHLNIPANNERPWDFICALSIWKKGRDKWPWKQWTWPGQTLRKVGWTTLGVFAPELVAFAAYQQFKDATALNEAVEERLSPPSADADPENPPAAVRLNKWTLVHSYFVIMGGFEVVVLEDRNFLPRERASGEARRRMRLSAGAFQVIAENFPRLIPDLPERDIKDKSKGDAIAKSLVCFQAAWFCAQCFARLGQRVGISLLELNTLGHALCAFLIYWIWWDKPLDVRNPEQLTLESEDERAFELVASLCFLSRIDNDEEEVARLQKSTLSLLKFYAARKGGRWKPADWRRLSPTSINNTFQSRLGPMHSGLIRQKLEQPFFPVITCGSDGKKWVAGLGDTTVRPKPISGSEESKLLWSQGTEFKSYLTVKSLPNCLPEASDETEKCLSGVRRLHLPLYKATDFEGISFPDIVNYVGKDSETHTSGLFTVNIPEVDIRRWELLSKDGGRYWHGELEARLSNRSRLDHSLSDRIRNFPRFGGIKQDMALYTGLAITGLIYGGLHCFAWNAPFATRAETVLWRVSSIVIMSTFILVLLLYCWEQSPPVPFQDWVDTVEDFWKSLGDLLGLLAVFLLPKKWRDHFRSSWKSCKRSFRSFWKLSENISSLPWVKAVLGGVKEVLYWGLWVPLLTFPRVLFDLTVAASVLLYCLARVYLVVECFINLSHLPESVFQVPVWSQYVPHIS